MAWRIAGVVVLGAGLLGACRADIEPPFVEEQPGRRDAGSVRLDATRGLPPAPSPGGAQPATPDAADPADAISPDGSDSDGGTGGIGSSGIASACGAEKPDISQLTEMDGLAIGKDGTIYFTRVGLPEAWVGRLRPRGGEPEPQWVRIPGSGMRLWGLALHGGGNRLYVASGANQAIYQVDLSVQPPEVGTLIDGLELPNDLAIDREGNVYYSERGDGKVYRVTAEGTRREVTPTPVGNQNSPTALTFGPDGALYAGTFNGPVVRIELVGGVEQRRAPYGLFDGRANGLIVDMAGRLYVGTFEYTNRAELVRIDDRETAPVQLQMGPHFSSMAFGRGALDCKDLYIAMPVGPMRRLETDTPGGRQP
jgi:sugar lactone lactonase YvrE